MPPSPLPRKRNVSRAKVIATAAALVDRDGSEAVTLARIAAELGVKPPSLYNHVGNHGELLDAVATVSITSLNQELQQATVGISGGDAIRELASAYRAFAAEHPGLYALIQRPITAQPTESSQAETDARLSANDSLLQTISLALRAWSLSDTDLVHVIRSLRSGLHGFVSIERSGSFQMDADPDESFSILVDILIAGIDSRAGHLTRRIESASAKAPSGS